MPLLRSIADQALEPDTWSACAELDADATDVLEALTDPQTIAAWAPVSFDVESPAGQRLRAGSRERVSGSIAGIGATFEVEVARADAERLELVASGPVSLDVVYTFRQRGSRVTVVARVAVSHRGGMRAQLLRPAVNALLRAGALQQALERLEDSLSDRYEPALIAA
jgi:hypothetical protein